MSLINNNNYSSVQSTRAAQYEQITPSTTAQLKIGIGGHLSTMASSTPATHTFTQFVSAVKDQILAWVRTVRVYILSKQLGDDASRLNMAIKNADLNLLEGLIELFQKRWNTLDLQTKKDFFIGLFNNENYLQAYQLAYKKGIPFNDKSFSSEGDQKAHILSYLVHEQPPLAEIEGAIYPLTHTIHPLTNTIHPKTAQLLQHFSTINDQVEELKQIPHCCSDCSLRYALVLYHS